MKVELSSLTKRYRYSLKQLCLRETSDPGVTFFQTQKAKWLIFLTWMPCGSSINFNQTFVDSLFFSTTTLKLMKTFFYHQRIIQHMCFFVFFVHTFSILVIIPFTTESSFPQTYHLKTTQIQTQKQIFISRKCIIYCRIVLDTPETLLKCGNIFTLVTWSSLTYVYAISRNWLF